MTIRDDQEVDKPLDPATERVRRKLVRLLAVSIGLMLIAVMAVLGAIVYKVSQPSGSSLAVLTGEEMALDVPPGSSVVDMALDGERALLRIRTGGEESIVLVDLTRGRTVARYLLEP